MTPSGAGLGALALVSIAAALGSFQPLGSQLRPRNGRPERSESGGYLGSGACKMCHPAEHQTWSTTYHRTMTRPAAALAWDGVDSPALPASLEGGGFRFTLTRTERGILARGPDLHAARSQQTLADVERELVMVTGSHHYLAFWLGNGARRELRQLPFVYLLPDKSWAPRSEVFLQPPEAPAHVATWNSNCIQCHSVAGQPHQSEWPEGDGTLAVRYDSTVGELGIACEACHGAGRAHAERMREPVERFRAHRKPNAAVLDGVVQPGRLNAVRSSAVCGQCHAYFAHKRPDLWWESGFAGLYRPGQALDVSREILLPLPEQLRHVGLTAALESIFWADGSIRIGGREYNGLLASACYQRGVGDRQLGCTACHSLHQGSRDDQLNAATLESPDAPCVSCHVATPEHSGHPSGTSGASCVNCHMPKTTYALLKGIRSHTIASPTLDASDPPSPCLLCHADKSRTWLMSGLAHLYPHLALPDGSPELTASDGGVEIPLAVRQALSGDAAVRAIFAAAFGSPELIETVGVGLPRQVLAILARDPYHAVRRIAQRSLATLPQADGQAVLPEEVLLRLHRQRDQTPVVMSE